VRLPKRDERGFTIVELLIAITIEAVLVAALGTALITTLKGGTSVDQSLDRSSDARIAAFYIVSDAKNSSGPEVSLATSTCTDAHPPVTGTATPIVEFESTSTSSAGVDTAHVVDYLLVGTSLLRRECTGTSTVSTSDRVVASNVGSVSAACAPVADCSGTPTSITLTVNEVADSSGSVYSYKVTGAFRKLGGAGPPVTPPSSGPAQSVILLGSGGTCPSGVDSINLAGGAHMTVYGKTLINATNGTNCNAMDISNGASFSSGSTAVLSGGTCTGSPCPTMTSYSPAIADPYAGLAVPSTSGMTTYSSSSCSGTLQPGRYTNGISATTGACTLASGVYVLNGPLTASNGASLTSAAGGVFIYLTSGAFTIGGGVPVNLSAMTTGTYAGLSLWQAAADTTTISWANGGQIVLNGALYAPKARLDIQGGSQAPVVGSLVVQSISMANGISITIGTPLTITAPTSLPSGGTGVAYTSTTSTGTGGGGTYTWSATALPAGMAINSSSGTISGTPTASGTFSVTITLNDSTGDAADTSVLSLTIVAPPSVSTSSLPNATMTVAYSTTLAGTGGTSPYTWAQTGLPTGLSLNTSTGVISGTATVGGTATVAITMTDASHTQATKSLSLVVRPAISSVTLTNKTGGTAGKIEAGDSVKVVFSTAMKVATFCSTWSGDTTNQALNTDNLVTVSVSNGTGSTNDVLTVTTASGCTFNFGSLNLGSNAYDSVAATFKGSGTSKSSVTYTTGTNTLLITLGAMTAGTVATVTSSAPVFTASGSIQDTNAQTIGNSPFTIATGKQF
jgi:type II secretory pathway pseudopilin PulG